MTDTPAISRSRVDADDLERRMRMASQPVATIDDPLAELARLVGKEDIFNRASTQARPAPVLFDAPRTEWNGEADEVDASMSSVPLQTDQPGAPSDPAVVHGPAGRPIGLAAAMRTTAHETRDVSPDRWAQGRSPSAAPDLAAAVDNAPSHRGSARRTLTVLGAVVVLTGGGLAASFLIHPSGRASVSGANAPTILAATGPTKVQPETPSGKSGASEPSTLLDKNKGDGTASAKVVDSVEQPVDLSQAVKPAQAAPETAPASGPDQSFVEVHKVHIVQVRPDGTIINDPSNAAAAPPQADLGTATSLFDTRTAMPMPDQRAPVAAAAPKPAAEPTPSAPVKTTVRAGTTPRAPVQTADATPGDVAPAPPPAKAKQIAAPTRTAAKPKPTEEGSATDGPNTATAGAGGAYAVQLGAPPSEQEAKDTMSRLQKKFSDALGSYRASVHPGASGTKTVYRIRVGNLSQDDAKTLCSKLQADGGACFVVRN